MITQIIFLLVSKELTPKLYTSSNQGDNWNQLTGFNATDYVSSFAINSNNDFFAGTYGSGVFRSTDNGATWIQINNGLYQHQIQTLLINSYSHIFAGTTSGLFSSTDNGENWV